MGTIANTAAKIAITAAIVLLINTVVIVAFSSLLSGISVAIDISPFLTTIQMFRGLVNNFVPPLVVNLVLLYPVVELEFVMSYWLYVQVSQKIFTY